MSSKTIISVFLLIVLLQFVTCQLPMMGHGMYGMPNVGPYGGMGMGGMGMGGIGMGAMGGVGMGMGGMGMGGMGPMGMGGMGPMGMGGMGPLGMGGMGYPYYRNQNGNKVGPPMGQGLPSSLGQPSGPGNPISG